MTYQVEFKSVFNETRWSPFCELPEGQSACTVAKALVKLTNFIRATRLLHDGVEVVWFDHEGAHYPEPSRTLELEGLLQQALIALEHFDIDEGLQDEIRVALGDPPKHQEEDDQCEVG
jgi:hypothetical protein